MWREVMAKLRCPCGNVLSNVSWPAKNNGFFVRSDKAGEIGADIIDDGSDVWECDKCGRIGFSIDNSVKWFTPDSGKYESICAWGE